MYKSEIDLHTQKTSMLNKGERGKDKLGVWD